MSLPKRMATCHPDRPHKAKGLCVSCYSLLWYKKSPPRIVTDRELAMRKVNRKKLKIKTLTMYGKGGELKCCWRNCQVTDLDMLTLDHVNNDGYKVRETLGGPKTWAKAVKVYEPEKYQTLCWNHQWKKRALHLRNHPEENISPLRGKPRPESAKRNMLRSPRNAIISKFL